MNKAERDASLRSGFIEFFIIDNLFRMKYYFVTANGGDYVMDIPPWEMEEQERFRQKHAEEKILKGLPPEHQQAYLNSEIFRQQLGDLFNSMIVTTQQVLPNIQKIYGIVSAYDFHINQDLKEDMNDLAKFLEGQLILELKVAAVLQGCNAIVGLAIDKIVTPVSYTEGAGVSYGGVGGASFTVHFKYCLNVSVYGTAVVVA